MDIARLLTPNDDDLRDENSALEVEGLVHAIARRSSPTSSSSPVTRRAPPPRRRKLQVHELRARVQAYELVLANLPIVLRGLDDELPSLPDYGGKTDADSQRMRDFLWRSIKLAQQSELELANRAEWLRLLRQHQISTAGLRRLMSGLVVDDWHWMCERWRALAQEHYVPLTQERCCGMLEETLEAIRSYEVPNDTRATMINIFGWRGTLLLESDRRYVHFHAQKTLYGDIDAISDTMWSFYQRGIFQQLNIDPHAKYFSQVVQRVSADTVVLQNVEKNSSLIKMAHSVSLVSRIKTQSGYLMSYRGMQSPNLQRLMQAEGLSLSGIFYWVALDIDSQDRSAIHTTVAGYMGSDNPAYAEYWGTEIMLSIIRAEANLTGQPIVSLESTK